MRVVHVVNSSDTGGAQTLIENLGRQKDSRDQVYCIVLGPPGALAARLDAVTEQTIHLNAVGRTSELLRLIPLLVTSLRRLHPDVVHSHLFQSNLLASLFRPRGSADVWTVHTSGHGAKDRPRTRFLSRLLRHLSQRPDAVVPCSPSAKAWMTAERWRPRRLQLIRNGVPLPMPTTEVDHAADSYLLSLSRAHPMKGHGVLFQAFAKLDVDVELRCAGLGVEPHNALIDRALANLPRDRRHKLQLLGSLQDPSGELRSATGLVISSTYGEALPMAGLEALALGVPVITTNVGDCAELAVDDRLLVPPDDPVGLGQAMQYLTGCTSQEYGELRRRSLERAARFDIAWTQQSYRNLYEEVMSK